MSSMLGPQEKGNLPCRLPTPLFTYNPLFPSICSTRLCYAPFALCTSIVAPFPAWLYRVAQTVATSNDTSPSHSLSLPLFSSSIAQNVKGKRRLIETCCFCSPSDPTNDRKTCNRKVPRSQEGQNPLLELISKPAASSSAHPASSAPRRPSPAPWSPWPGP